MSYCTLMTLRMAEGMQAQMVNNKLSAINFVIQSKHIYLISYSYEEK